MHSAPLASLDCRTDVGRAYIARQHAIVAACARQWQVQAVATPDDADSPFDVMFTRGGVVAAIAEVKARNCARAELQRFGSYLITREKIEQGRHLARTMRAPYLVIVGLTDGICYWRVAHADGRWAVRFTEARTVTQATCNGGRAVRLNAYLALDAMRVLPAPAPARRELHADDIRWG